MSYSQNFPYKWCKLLRTIRSYQEDPHVHPSSFLCKPNIDTRPPENKSVIKGLGFKVVLEPVRAFWEAVLLLKMGSRCGIFQ